MTRQLKDKQQWHALIWPGTTGQRDNGTGEQSDRRTEGVNNAKETVTTLELWLARRQAGQLADGMARTEIKLKLQQQWVGGGWQGGGNSAAQTVAVNALLSAWINNPTALDYLAVPASVSVPAWRRQLHLSHSQHMLTTWWPKVKWLKCPAHCKQTPPAQHQPRGERRKKATQLRGGATRGHMQIQANKIIIQIFGLSHER